jgi:hypothetical protein
MNFTVTAKIMLGLLDNVCKGMRKKQRTAFYITLSAGRKMVSVRGNGMDASTVVPVRGQGQCQLSWTKITDILATFPPNEPIHFECNRHGLKLNNFSMQVEHYGPKAVTKAEALPSVVASPSGKKPAKERGDNDAQRLACWSDGYSLMPPVQDENDVTGKLGMVMPEDTQGPRLPLVCPVCGRVGYFAKRYHKGNTYYSFTRTWVTAAEADALVLISSREERSLCPRCVSERFAVYPQAQPIPNQQTDMFDSL